MSAVAVPDHADARLAKRPFLHPLAGARLTPLLRTVIAHGGFSPRYGGQFAFMVLGCLLRWPMCAFETLRVERRVRRVAFDPPPIFVVGHWRSGTTFLHNLLGLDPAFVFPTALDVFRPYEFYPSPLDVISRTLLLRSLPATRPMDDVPLLPGLPQEEEWALAAMGAPSFLNGLYFPRSLRTTHEKEVLFDGASPEALRRWATKLRYYLAKLVVRQPDRRLLLKNPAHSARIGRLRTLFPNSKFIHIHRHPLAVFESTRDMYRGMLPLVSLQDCEQADIDMHILWLYPRLMDRLLADFGALPVTDRVEVRYEDLVSDPAATVAGIYEALGLQRFDIERSLNDAKMPIARSSQRPSRYIASEISDRARQTLAPFVRRLGYECT
jgi:omega-hydroxy-beta-dihydromenaquinone-9 sulfotransferase